MEFKGTKGYWHLDGEEEAHKGEYRSYELDINFSEHEAHCATVYCLNDTPTEEELANARLMAAAPELLEACLEFVRKCDNGTARSIKSYAQMKNAINKALNGDFKNT